jgi:hypothetical protein
MGGGEELQNLIPVIWHVMKMARDYYASVMSKVKKSFQHASFCRRATKILVSLHVIRLTVMRFIVVVENTKLWITVHVIEWQVIPLPNVCPCVARRTL